MPWNLLHHHQVSFSIAQIKVVLIATVFVLRNRVSLPVRPLTGLPRSGKNKNFPRSGKGSFTRAQGKS